MWQLHFLAGEIVQWCMNHDSQDPSARVLRAKRRLNFDDDDVSSPSPPLKRRLRTSNTRNTNKLPAHKQYEFYLRYRELKVSKGSPPGAISQLCKDYGVSPGYPSHLRRKAGSGFQPDTFADKPRSGRPKIMTPTKVKALRTIGEKSKYTLSTREYSVRLKDVGKSSKGSSYCTVNRYMHKNKWRVVKKSSVPLLTAEHKAARLEWATQHREDPWIAHVDLDEKWFYGVVMTGKHRLPPGVPAPKVPLQSKRFISKAMMLTAVAKPNADHNFDGKLGCWPVVKWYTALRSSKNHQRGEEYQVETTMDTKQFKYMISQLLARSIRAKMKWAQEVFVQMDNAPPHTDLDQLEREINQRAHPKITFVRQPPQSPDTNVNDLGLYAHMQKVFERRNTRVLSPPAIRKEVRRIWEAVDVTILTKLFADKSLVLEQIISHNGGNNFPLPHSSKSDTN